LNSLRQRKLAGEIDRVGLTSPDILTPSPMSAEPATRGFDIGYVLFIDIVGYSKLSGEEQKRVVRQLNETVRATPEFQRAQAAGELLRLPAGDGMALIFSASPEAPVQCALEISPALKEQPHMQVRMGVNSGPIDQVEDVNDQSNVSGAGINMAQRVMSCGDAGHILVARRVADDLAQYEKWRPYIHELGEVEVKHGVKIDIVNLCFGGIGNSELPDRIKESRRRQKLARKKRLIFGAALILTALFLAWAVYHQIRKRKSALAVIPPKGIAVLPFENLSSEKENAYFADGVQDEILTNLARIADLKVISRVSTMQYKAGAGRNARAIGQALGVAHLLEGSVQRSGGRIRVNAQLIDARNDAHLWAQSYDRTLADVFAIQSEIAKTIADQLQARLSSRERAEIERPPTSNEAAFDLYIRAKALLASASFVGSFKANCMGAVDLLNQAVTRDPDFFPAYCQLAFAHGQIYFFNFDHTPQRCSLLNDALQNAVRLRPDAGETHLARAEYLYRCHLNYDGARAELAIATRLLPNNSAAFALAGSVDRRQGRWEDSARNFERALLLDPRNLGLLQQIGATYDFLRRYGNEAAAYDRAIEIAPDDMETRIIRAAVDVEWHADVRRYHDAIHNYLANNPKAKEEIASDWFGLALLERDSAEADRALAFIPADGVNVNSMLFPRPWYEGWAARLRGDKQAPLDAFTRAHNEAELAVTKQPDSGPALAVLGVIDAALGRKEEAIGEGRRAIELLPVEKDSINGSYVATNLALIYALAGEKDLAIDYLRTLFEKPGDVSYGNLRLQPFWDPLRGDPRFEKLVASLAPKD
jgi:TolB-like protein/class 3 adenylate cyclase